MALLQRESSFPFKSCSPTACLCFSGDAVSETVPEASAAVQSPAMVTRKHPTAPSTESAEELSQAFERR